jgi:hypothetical protein
LKGSHNRLIHVWVKAGGHLFVLLFEERHQMIALRQIFVWAFDPHLPWFTWDKADQLLNEVDRVIEGE